MFSLFPFLQFIRSSFGNAFMTVVVLTLVLMFGISLEVTRQPDEIWQQKRHTSKE